jgi:hypothetical protein
MIYLATLLGMTSFLIIRALFTWLVKIGPSPEQIHIGTRKVERRTKKIFF